MQTVLITGVGGPAGRNAAKLFSEQGWRVIGVDMQMSAQANAAATTFRQVVAATDPSYLTQLRQLAEEFRADVVVPTVSEELPLISRHTEQLPALVAISEPGAIATAHDKYLTWLHLKSEGIPAPIALLAEVARDQPAQVAAELGLPFISKPRVGRGGRGVRLHDGPEQIADLAPDLMLQAFASGTEYTVNLCWGLDSDVVIVLEKLEMKDGMTGNAVRIKRVEAPDVAEIAARTAASLGLRGVLDMDIRRSEQGSPQILEVNARFGANISHAPEVFTAFLSSLKGAAWKYSPSSSTSRAV